MPEEKVIDNLSEEERDALLEEEEAKKLEEEKTLLEKEEKEEEEKEKEEKELSDEELDALLGEDEANRLDKLGFPQFKTVDEMAKNFQKFIDEDKMTFPIVKELASAYKMTPHDFINAVKEQIEGKKTLAPSSKKPSEGSDKKYKEFETELGNIRLDMRFERFQRVMGKEDVDIPDNLRPKLIKLLPAVVAGKTEDEINDSLLFDEAYELYLFKLSKEKDPEKLKAGLKPFDAKRLAKLRQLGISSKKKTTKGFTSQDVKDFGEGITKL